MKKEAKKEKSLGMKKKKRSGRDEVEGNESRKGSKSGKVRSFRNPI